jgi:enoyl-CoA hydratase
MPGPMSPDELVHAKREGPEGVRLIEIDRPEKRNALDGATRQALLDRMEAAIDDGARALVLTGTEGTFASGADLAEMRARSVAEQRDFIALPRMYERIEALEAPVLAAIDGHALGAGLELALACDVRVAAEGAKLGSPEVNLGIIPGGGATQRLPRLVGLGQAMRLVLTGELVDAREARELGLVEVHTDEQARERALELAGRMAEHSAVALAGAKRALRASWQTHLAEGLREEIDRFADVFGSRDAQEGIEAFLEDREPEFTHE